MDAARGLGVPPMKGHGWPLRGDPRSSDGVREVERSETRMQGQAFLVTFSATGKSDSPVRGETRTTDQHANDLDPELNSAARRTHNIASPVSNPPAPKEMRRTKKCRSLGVSERQASCRRQTSSISARCPGWAGLIQPGPWSNLRDIRRRSPGPAPPPCRAIPRRAFGRSHPTRRGRPAAPRWRCSCPDAAAF